MEFGISFLPDRTPDNLSPVEYFDDALDLSVSAEQLGYHYVKMTEHYMRAYGGYCPSPFAFLAAVAARTTRIRLMTGGCLPVFHHPLQLASEAAMIDAISHGRLEVGMARAYLPYEFEALGVDIDGSRERFNASVDAIVRLWTEESVSYRTPYFEFKDVTSLPRPVQQPHPPVLIAAVRTKESFERIGQLGYGLLMTSGSEASAKEHVRAYREEFLRHHGDSGAQPRVVASLPMLVADTQAEADALADQYLAEYLRAWIGSADSWNNTTSADYKSYSGFGYYLRSLSGPKMRDQGMALVGPADEVVERAMEFSAGLGDLDAILWQVDFGGLPRTLAHESLAAFAAAVGLSPATPKAA
jgi:alkanesulfonate monooxygenase SsuD/methylene tetrahydromethanopterin reductase-like flavin-dependent oxidoreductase (luciferase family)